MNVDRLFDAAAKERIAAAVRDAEAGTTGQIVPVVVERSQSYHAGFALLGVLWIASVAVDFALRPFSSSFSSGVPAWSALALGCAIAAIPTLRRAFVRHDFEPAVRRRALAAFLEHNLHQTRDATGVLVFASLYERKVVILGDRAIHEKMGDAGWREAVDKLVSAIGAGRPADGFCDAIALVGKRLAESFPRTAGAPGNELPDALNVNR